MLPNLLDDLLKAWDAKAPAVEPVQEAAPPPLPLPLLEPEPEPELEVQAAPGTPMDELLSNLLASFSEVPPEAVPDAEDVPLPPPPVVRERETLGPIAMPQPAPASTKKFVAVSFGRHKIAFSIDSVVEAGRYPQTTFVPGLPPYIRGVFAFRGSVLPVVDTRQLTGAPERFLPHECRVLTIQSGNAKAAFVFDALEGIVNLDPESMEPADENHNMPMREMLTGVNSGAAPGEIFGVADAGRLLDLAGCLKELA